VPAGVLDRSQPEEIERDGSDGPYGDNVFDLNDEMAERLRVSFHAQQRHHSPARFCRTSSSTSGFTSSASESTFSGSMRA
jgi:hypothetical protein